MGFTCDVPIPAPASDQWFNNAGLPWWGSVAKHLLQAHKIVKHVAFVMDGNRRYARRHHLSSVIEGHRCGFEQMTKVLDWCNELGITEVTVYAFSMENFNRDESEVNGLMKMARSKFKNLLKNKDKLKERQICVRFFGNMNRLPEDIQQLVAKIEYMTCDHSRCFINICLSYSSQDEIARAMEWIRRGVQSDFICEKDINSELIAQCLDSRFSKPVDMLIRTSGEHRLSDFLLLQCSNSYLHFENVLWPEMTFWHLFKAIISFQQNRAFGQKIDMVLKNSTEQNSLQNPTEIDAKRVEKFLSWVKEERRKSLIAMMREQKQNGSAS